MSAGLTPPMRLAWPMSRGRILRGGRGGGGATGDRGRRPHGRDWAQNGGGWWPGQPSPAAGLPTLGMHPAQGHKQAPGFTHPT